MTPSISVVFIVLNEEKHLPSALRSVEQWAGEIVVVDMHSDDRTVEIAQQYGAKVFYHERIAAFDGARDYAVRCACGDWILMLDADELVPKCLSDKLMKTASNASAEIYLIPRANYFNGDLIRFAGWGAQQDQQMRFFKKGSLSLDATIHNFMHPRSGARLESLPYEDGAAIQHFSYTDISQFYEKLNRYTSVEAQQARERGEKPSLFKAIIHSLREFVARYIKKQGFRDGWRGLHLSLLYMIYRWTVYAKLRELYATGGHQKIVEKYQDVANAIIAEYGKIRQP